MRSVASRLLVVVLLVLSVVMLPEAASAAVRPHKARGSAQFVSPTEFVGSGNATHLGAYQEAGTVAFSPTSNPAVLHVEGTIIYTAANGDELHAAVVGELNGATGHVTATVTYVGGTGRFADASGSSVLEGDVSPTGAITVAVRGSIDF